MEVLLLGLGCQGFWWAVEAFLVGRGRIQAGVGADGVVNWKGLPISVSAPSEKPFFRVGASVLACSVFTSTDTAAEEQAIRLNLCPDLRNALGTHRRYIYLAVAVVASSTEGTPRARFL